MMPNRRSQGFTLIELVVVVVLLGIISLGTVQFISQTAQGYALQAQREQLAGSARVVLAQLGREIRNALPNSIRISGECIEFVSVVAGGRYVSAPTTTASNQVTMVPLTQALPSSGSVRLALFPENSNRFDGSSAANPIYDVGANAGESSSWAIISPVVSNPNALNSVGSDVTVNLTIPVSGDGSAGHQFPSESPRHRIFVVSSPVSFCRVSDRFYRYQNYGYRLTQPTPGSGLPSTEPNRVVLATQLAAASAPAFQYMTPTLQRNAAVLISLQLQNTSSGDQLALQHEIRIRNVP